MPAVDTGVPTLSQIEGWDTEHLQSAARTWTATAEHWEDTFSAVHRGSLNPGGTVWEGDGAEAAQQRTFADLVTVRGLSDHLHEAATVARRGADQLDYYKRAALDAVDEARESGFNVGEDLSVSDRSMVPLGPAFAARQAQAQTLAAEIRVRAAALSAADREVAAHITATTAPLSEISFEEEPATATIQAVDYHQFKQSPIPKPGTPDDPAGASTGPPTAADLRRILDELPDGNKLGIKEVRSPEDLQRLWEWAKQNGTEIPDGYGEPGKGTQYQLPDGTLIGQRSVAESTRLPALDINLPGEGYTKVHINPRGGIPDIPATAGQPATVSAIPRVPGPVVEPVPPQSPVVSGFRGTGGAPITPVGPTLVPPPHSIDHLPVLGENDLDAPWEYEP